MWTPLLCKNGLCSKNNCQLHYDSYAVLCCGQGPRPSYMWCVNTVLLPGGSVLQPFKNEGGRARALAELRSSSSSHRGERLLLYRDPARQLPNSLATPLARDDSSRRQAVFGNTGLILAGAAAAPASGRCASPSGSPRLPSWKRRIFTTRLEGGPHHCLQSCE